MDDMENLDTKGIDYLAQELEEKLSASVPQSIMEALNMIELLAPYVRTEYKENPGKYDNGKPVAECGIIAAAARRARADGKHIPLLVGEEFGAEQLEMQLPIPVDTSSNKGKERKPTNKKNEANKSGALTDVGRLLIVSDRDYQNAFSSDISASIGLFIIDALTNLKLKDNGMQISFLDNGILDLADANQKTGARPLKDADTGFLRAMARAAYKTRTFSDSMITKFYLPSFCDELEIQGERASSSRALARKKEILGRIGSMDNVWGKLPGKNQWWKVFTLLGFDEDTEIITVAMPYFNQLLSEIDLKARREIEAGNKYYIGFCDLLHSNAANERNTASIELAARVLIGVQQRGCTPDSKLKQNKRKSFNDSSVCTWSISCAGLIEECPQMREKLEDQKTTGGRNKTLQRAFSTMYKILKEKSDLSAYYKDLSIYQVMPTTKTLDARIIIKHHGLDSSYQRPLTIEIDRYQAGHTFAASE